MRNPSILTAVLMSSQVLLDIGLGAKLHGPMTFKNEKGEIILQLEASGSVAVEAKPSGSSADKRRTR
jgi:hypothetical protein